MTDREVLYADVIITMVVAAVLYEVGAGWWSLLILPYGAWNYYHGRISVRRTDGAKT